MPPPGGHPAPNLGLLPGLRDKALSSPQIPALLLTRKNPASILLPRSEIAPYPKMHRAAATEGGTGWESGATGRRARRSTRPSSRHEAALAQCGELPPNVRTRTGGRAAAWAPRLPSIQSRMRASRPQPMGARESRRLAPPYKSFCGA